MPIIEMPDGTQVDLGDNPSSELKAAAAAKVQSLLGTQPETPAALPSAPPDASEPEPGPPPEAPPTSLSDSLGRAGDYLTKKASDLVGAYQNIQADIGGLVTGRSLFPEPEASQRGTMARLADVGTLAAPAIAPELLVAGTAAGATARGFGAPQNVAENIDLGTQLAKGGAEALFKGADAFTSAAPAAGKFVKGLAEGGSEEAAGEALQQTAAPTLRTTQKAQQAATFGTAEQLAAQHGLSIVPGTPEADQFGKELLATQEKWGPVMHPAERRVTETLLDRLTAPQGAPVTYDDLGKYSQGLQKIKGASTLRTVLGSAMDRMLSPVEEATQARSAGTAWWGGTGKLQRQVAATIEKAQTPVEAFNRTVGKLNDAARAGVLRDALQAEHPEAWDTVRRGFYSKLFRGVEDGPTALGKWSKLPEEVRTVYDPEGKVLTTLQNFTEAPGKVAKGIQWGMTKAPHAGVALSAAHNPLALVYAATNLLKAPVGVPGRLATGLAATVGPLARTGAAVSGQALGGLSDVLPTAPATTEDQGTAPAEPTAPEAAPSSSPAPSAPRAAADLGGGTFSDQAMRAADLAGVPRPLMAAVMAQESAGRPNALNPTSGATGLMQLMPGTFAQHARSIEAITGRPASIRNPVDNLLAGALELRKNLEAAGGSTLGTAAYYYGGMDPRQHGPKTRAYAARILQRVRGLMA